MRRHLMTMTATTLLLVGALAACGSDDADEKGNDSSSSSQTDEGSGYPACDDVWVVGEPLPEGYEGCDDGGTIIAAVSTDCQDGMQMISHDDTYWAVSGGPIKEKTVDEIAADEGYKAAYDECLG